MNTMNTDDKYFLFNCVGELVSNPKGCTYSYLIKCMKNRESGLYKKVWGAYNDNWFKFKGDDTGANTLKVYSIKNQKALDNELLSDLVEANKIRKVKKCIVINAPKYMLNLYK